MAMAQVAQTAAAGGQGAGSSEVFVPSSGGHELQLTVVRPASAQAGAPGILFVHGVFSDGRFFQGSDGGTAGWFVEQGCTAFIGNLRAHGKSRRSTPEAWDWSFDDYVRHDLPALIRAARERHDGPLFLLAHSMGGYVSLAALGLDPEVQGMLRGACVLSAAVNDFTDGGLKKVAMVRFARLLSGVLGHFPAKRLKQGVANEPAALMKQFDAWAQDGSFRSVDGKTDYWQALGKVALPVFAAVGEADVFHASPRRAQKLVDRLGSPDKQLLVAGRSRGFERDYGHFDLARGSRARKEIFPRLLEWMRAHAG